MECIRTYREHTFWRSSLSRPSSQVYSVLWSTNHSRSISRETDPSPHRSSRGLEPGFWQHRSGPRPPVFPSGKSTTSPLFLREKTISAQRSNWMSKLVQPATNAVCGPQDGGDQQQFSGFDSRWGCSLGFFYLLYCCERGSWWS